MSTPSLEAWTAALGALSEVRGRNPSEVVAFASRVPSSYVERTSPRVAVADMDSLAAFEKARQSGRRAPQMAVVAADDDTPALFRLRLYGEASVELSSFVPVLESFGLVVVDAIPHRIEGTDGGRPLLINDFGLRVTREISADVEIGPEGLQPSDGARLIAAIAASWAGDAEIDSFNRLVLSAGLVWRDVLVLRTYQRYRRQAGTRWTDEQLVDPLVLFPEVTRALLRYFGAKLDPGLDRRPGSVGPDGTGAGDAQAARRLAVEALGVCQRLEDDQVLGGYLELIDATWRTNHYQRDGQGRPPEALAVKLDGAKIPELPRPRLMYETFVHSVSTEGLHLRGGPIARGGIRWSDRVDDLRTEVLGLVRAQVLKNATIVPTGAKGGFVCRMLVGDQPPPGMTVKEAVRQSYQVFIGSMLDITDNVVNGEVVHPPAVMALDGDDPYLVVAADRGTADLSDVANQLSETRGFWLGDAFASGGSHGYDHKAMGITARGAWVAVKQHFRQLGIDVQREPIRVIGVGDMSGDVFGNAMLQSDQIKLVGAFDHRHVFVDPDPDPAVSFAERRRLFERPASSWQDYDHTCISDGGGVWSRSAKSIELNDPIRRLIGAPAQTMSPPELVTALLHAPVDLLFFGGIGTFVKASSESSADVGDHANDMIRVDANTLRARVVTEGGNLAVTQRGRIQYARRGGRINTDFIDNAAGVATSDREVNLKILLTLAIDRGWLEPDQRDGVLAESEHAVGEAVLDQVERTISALGRAMPDSASDLDSYEALLERLEMGELNRAVEALPDSSELEVRRQAGAGLIRPELAVILAYATSDLVTAIENSSLVEDPALEEAVVSYFPRPITRRFAGLIPEHRLHRQLAAIAVGGQIIERIGVTWASEIADELGVGLDLVARAYWAALGVLDGAGHWAEAERLRSVVDSETEAALHHAISAAVVSLARHYLLLRPEGLDSLEQVVSRDRAVALRLVPLAVPVPVVAPGGTGQVVDIDTLAKDGVDEVNSVRLLALRSLARLVGVATGVGVSGNEIELIPSALAVVERVLGLDRLDVALGGVQPAGRWERWAARGLIDDLGGIRLRILRALRDGPGLGDEDALGEELERLVSPHQRELSQIDQLIGQVQNPSVASAARGAAAAVAMRRAGNLVDRLVADLPSQNLARRAGSEPSSRR